MNQRVGIPRVSVVMPSYNHAPFVRGSVESILQQTMADLELVVVDDCSKDDSVAVLRELAAKDARLKLIVHEKNRGASRSRNDGLRAARGEFVAFCDADDLWKPDKLERQIALLSGNADCDVTYCDAEIVDENGELTGEMFSGRYPLPRVPSGDLFEALSTTNFINMQTVLARRRALGDRLLFDEGIQWVEDWWQWIRLARHHRFVYDPRCLAFYRVHRQSTSRTQRCGILRNRWKVCKRNIRAHRDMPVRLRAAIWYQMGVGLCLMGRRRRGCRYLWHAIRLGWTGKLPFSRLARMSVRSGLEWGRSVMPSPHWLG